MALEIANDRPIALIAFPRPVVDADYGRRRLRRPIPAAHDPEQRVVADRHHEAPGETRSRSAAEREGQMMDDVFEASGSTGAGRDNVIPEPLGENGSATCRRHATETPGCQGNTDHSPCERQIRKSSRVMTVNTFGNRTTIRAFSRRGDGARLDRRDLTINRDTVDAEPRRNDCRRSQSCRHGADSP